MKYFCTFSNTLKKRRKALGLSLRNVEEGTGTSASTISRMERGGNVEHKHYVAVTSFYEERERIINTLHDAMQTFSKTNDNSNLIPTQDSITYQVGSKAPQESTEKTFKLKDEPNLSELTDRISKLEDTVSKLTKPPAQTVPQKGKEETETKYPCLMRNKNSGSIILFLGHELGIRITSPRGRNIETTGEVESNWDMTSFEPFSFQEPEFPTKEEIDRQAEAAHPNSHGNRWAFRQGADFVLNYTKRKQQKNK